MDSIPQFIKLFDMIPQSPQFKIGGEKSHKTVLGAFFSIGAVVTLFVFGYLLGKDVVQRNYPLLVKLDREAYIPPVFQIDNQLLPIMFGVSDEFGSAYIDQSIGIGKFLIRKRKMKEVDGKLQYEFTTETVKAEVCNTTKHLRNNQEMVEFSIKNNISNYYCFPIEEKDFKFGGSFFFSDYYDFSFQFIRCNSSQSAVCKSQELIDQQLNRGYINIYYPNFNLDPTLPDPRVKKIFNQYTAYSYQLPQTLVLKFKQVSLSVDRGIFFESIDHSNEIGFQSVYEMTEVQLNENIIFSLKFMASSAEEIIKIQYKKIQQFLAQLGVIVQILFSAIGILVFLFQEMDYNLKLINELYNWKVRYLVNKNGKEIKNASTQDLLGSQDLRSIDPDGILNKISSKNINSPDSKGAFQFEIGDSCDTKMIQKGKNSGGNIKINQVQVVPYETFRINDQQTPQVQESIDELTDEISLQDYSSPTFHEKEYKLTFRDQLKIICRMKSSIGSQMYFRSMKKIEDLSDVITINKKLQELQILQYLILNKDQQTLLMSTEKQNSVVFIKDQSQNTKLTASSFEELFYIDDKNEFIDVPTDQLTAEIIEQVKTEIPEQGQYQMSLNQKLLNLLQQSTKN